MNKDKFIELLYLHLSSFKTFDLLVDEVFALLKASGAEDVFLKTLHTRLGQLTALGKLATNLAEFEKLTEDIYSLHCSGKGFNIRILYGFMPSGLPVLLHAFYEREGKRITDYTNSLPIAQKRFAEMEAAENE